MNIIKIILLVIFVIIVLVLVIALFVPKEYHVKKEITINKPSQEVFEYVKFVRNQDNYNKWVMADPGMQKKFTGTDGEVGFIYGWNSTDGGVGEGEEEITNIEDGRKISLQIRFVRPFKGIGLAEMTTEPAGEGQTKVSWGMKGESKYPMNFTNLFVLNILGKDLEQSLNNLKGILEK